MPGSLVWAEGPVQLFQPFAIKDLKVVDAFGPRPENREYYYVVKLRRNLDPQLVMDATVIHPVSRDGAPLTVIKRKE
jgi:hypothetical protein